MSKGIFYRLMITLVATCLMGTQSLYAQNVTRYESRQKGAWEDANTWDVVTIDSQGNEVREVATEPPQSSDDVVVNHPIDVNNEFKEISSLTVTGNGSITSETVATDINIEVENDIRVESGGRISTTRASDRWYMSTGSIGLESISGNVIINGTIETGNGLNALNTDTHGGSSGSIRIYAPEGLLVIGNGARLATGRGGNGAESNDGGFDATNGGNSGGIILEGRHVNHLGDVLTGEGGNGGDAGSNGGEGGDAGDSGGITIVGSDVVLNGPVQTSNGGRGGNSKANNQDAGNGGDSGDIYVRGPFFYDDVNDVFDIDIDETNIVIGNSDITQGRGGAGGEAAGSNASSGRRGRQGGVEDASDQDNPCPSFNGIVYMSLESPKSGLEGAFCSIESQSDVIITGLHDEAIIGEFGVVISAPGVIDLTKVQAGKNMIVSPAGEIVFHVSDADNILLAPGMSLAEITEPDAIVIEDLPIAYIVIDDFEDYTDYPPNEVFMTWIDGWGDPDNGSYAGYPDQDYIDDGYIMETEIVHSGRQSMPVFYDNSVGLSEVTRTLNANWAQYGVDTLTLWYHGVKGNDAEPMYIALNGNAIVTNNDPNAALVDDWTRWDIPLQLFTDQGVNLEIVDTMSIGFGNKANPVAGGEGYVFFDDIRLYLPKMEAE
jgi:hypothetical protein